MDLINFGVSPGLLLYVWKLKDLGWPGFLICVTYIAAMVPPPPKITQASKQQRCKHTKEQGECFWLTR